MEELTKRQVRNKIYRMRQQVKNGGNDAKLKRYLKTYRDIEDGEEEEKLVKQPIKIKSFKQPIKKNNKKKNGGGKTNKKENELDGKLGNIEYYLKTGQLNEAVKELELIKNQIPITFYEKIMKDIYEK
jgi:hypothetical protein